MILCVDFVIDLCEIFRSHSIIFLICISELFWLLLRSCQYILYCICNNEVLITLQTHNRFFFYLRHILSLFLLVSIHLLLPTLVHKLILVVGLLSDSL